MRIRRFGPLLLASAVLGLATAGPGSHQGSVRLATTPASAIAHAATFQALTSAFEARASALAQTEATLEGMSREVLRLGSTMTVTRDRLARAEQAVVRILEAQAGSASTTAQASAGAPPVDPAAGDEAPASTTTSSTQTTTPSPTPSASPSTAGAPAKVQTDRAYARLAVAVRAFQAVVAQTNSSVRRLQRQARSLWRELDQQARQVEGIMAEVRREGSETVGPAGEPEVGAASSGHHIQANLAALRAEVRQIQVVLAAQRSQLGRQERGSSDRLETDLAKDWAPVGTPTLGDGVFHVCPVDPPRSFTDDFGAPRWAGGFHLHQGNDVFAPYGTPIRAPFDGRAEITGNSLGGLAVTVYGADGFAYNAHLSKYGSLGQVTAGTVIGYVGNSGDAAGGPTHDHFEWHPGGGAAVDPYPFLVAACGSAAA